MAYSFSNTCVLVARDQRVQRVAQRAVESGTGSSALMPDRAGRAGLVLQRIAPRDEHGVARRGDAGEQRIVAVARQRDVAEPSAPADGRAFAAVRLPDRLLVVVREQFRRQRISDAVRALVLRQRGRLDQRPTLSCTASRPASHSALSPASCGASAYCRLSVSAWPPAGVSAVAARLPRAPAQCPPRPHPPRRRGSGDTARS